MKFSVITVNFNNLAGLRETVESVLQQDYPDVEYIVVDGLSTDGGADYLRGVQSRMAHCLIERDAGIYHAMNKGLRLATGDYLVFMNSGDCFAAPDVLSRAAAFGFDEEIVWGEQIRQYDGGRTRHFAYDEPVDLVFFSRKSLPHQSMFMRRDIFSVYGEYREDFRIFADWEYVTRLVLAHGVRYRHIPLVVSRYDMRGISNDPGLKALRQAERARAKEGMLSPLVWQAADQNHELRQALQRLEAKPLVRLQSACSRWWGRIRPARRPHH